MVAMRDKSSATFAVRRLASCEPLGFEAGDNNWYRFVANGPTTGLDPTGLAKEDTVVNSIGEVKALTIGDTDIEIYADGDPKHQLVILPGSKSLVLVGVAASDKKPTKNRWWIAFKKIVELKGLPPNPNVAMPLDPARAWQIDPGFESPTTRAFVDQPGVGAVADGDLWSKTAYYAVGIVCRSKDGKSVSPLLSSFVYSIRVVDSLGPRHIGSASYKIPDGKFPDNWAALLGVTIDEKLTCDC